MESSSVDVAGDLLGKRQREWEDEEQGSGEGKRPRESGDLEEFATDGLDEAGLEATGLEDTGFDSTGLEETGVEDTGFDGTGLEDTGLVDTGLDDTGLEDTGLVDTGLDDAGLEDTGLEDTGLDGTGLEDTGLEDAGLEGTGLEDTGLEGTGLEDGLEGTGLELEEDDDLFDDVDGAEPAADDATDPAAGTSGREAAALDAQAHADVLDELHDEGHASEAEEEAPQPKKKKGEDMQEMFNIVKAFVSKLEYSAEADCASFESAKPAVKKLSMLKELEDMVAMKKRHETLLNGGLLGALKSWLEPMTDPKTQRMVLPHVKVRAAVFRALSKLPLDTHHQESRDRLKTSRIGPVLVFYSKCSKETIPNQMAANDLVQGWIMPIVEEGRNDMRDKAVMAQKKMEQKRSLKNKRQKEKQEDLAEAELRKKQQEGLKVGNPGYRYHARIPKQARLDYVEMPQVPTSVAQRLGEKQEREGGTRALIKKQVLKIDRMNRTSGKQRASTVKVSGKYLGADM